MTQCLTLATLSEDSSVGVPAHILRVKEQNKPNFVKEIHFRQELTVWGGVVMQLSKSQTFSRNHACLGQSD